MDLNNAIRVSSSGLKAQGTRLRVIAENLANANSTGTTPGDMPYRRKVLTFRGELDRAAEIEMVKVARVDVDRSDFPRRYDPGHPSADADGYVLLPNVNPLIEASDMREAQRSYEANINVIEASRNMIARTIDILRA